MGRSTCASVSAFSFDAQPAHFERVVRRIWRPDGDFAGLLDGVPEGVSFIVGFPARDFT
jgi:hypothetical protein